MSPNLASQVSAHRILVGLWELDQKRAFLSGISLQPAPDRGYNVCMTSSP